MPCYIQTSKIKTNLLQKFHIVFHRLSLHQAITFSSRPQSIPRSKCCSKLPLLHKYFLPQQRFLQSRKGRYRRNRLSASLRGLHPLLPTFKDVLGYFVTDCRFPNTVTLFW
uniref:Uncharacterized protein n=1 Tax=Tetraselmis sp. GSL018 TaxID=582737 RepID=A0A061SCK5_9CHLO